MKKARRILAFITPVAAAIVLSVLLPHMHGYHASATLILEPGYTTGFVGYSPTQSKLHVKLTCMGASANVTLVEGGGMLVWRIVDCNSTLSWSIGRGPFVLYVRVLNATSTSLGGRGRVELWLMVAP